MFFPPPCDIPCPVAASPIQLGVGDQQTIGPTGPCATSRNPRVYGLTDFNVNFMVINTGTVRTTFHEILLGGNGPRFDAIVTATTFTLGPLIPATSVARILGVQKIDNTNFVYVQIQSGNGPTFYYQIGYELFSDGDFSVFLNLCFPSSLSVNIPTNPEGVGALPDVRGRIFATNDGQNICQGDFEVETESETSFYVKYCIPLQKVLLGSGCTVAEKAASLGVDFSSLVSYSMLRYVLSKILYGSFNVQFLRQRYYQQFLRDLAASTWRSFVVYFQDPIYGWTSYWSLFKK